MRKLFLACLLMLSACATTPQQFEPFSCPCVLDSVAKDATTFQLYMVQQDQSRRALILQTPTPIGTPTLSGDFSLVAFVRKVDGMDKVYVQELNTGTLIIVYQKMDPGLACRFAADGLLIADSAGKISGIPDQRIRELLAFANARRSK